MEYFIGFYLLIIGHFILDYGYALSSKMIEAKSKGYPIGPIAKHAGLHSLSVYLILCLFFPYLSWKLIFVFCLLEFVTHFNIDTLKGMIQNKYPKLKDSYNPLYWHLFQIDQLLHISIKFLIIYLISIYNCK